MISTTTFRYAEPNQVNRSTYSGTLAFPRSCSPSTRATILKYAPGPNELNAGLRTAMRLTVETDATGYTIKATSSRVPGATNLSARIEGSDEAAGKALDAFAAKLEQVGKRWAQQANATAVRIEDLYVP